MGALWLPRECYEQPQEAVEIAPEWADGIQVAYPAPVLGEAGVNGKLLSNVAVPAAYTPEIAAWGRSLHGAGSSATASKGVFGEVGDIQYSGAAELAIFVMCQIDSLGSSTEAPILRATDGPGGTGIALELYPSTKRIRCLVATSGTTGWSGSYDETDSAITDGVPWIFAVAYRSGNRRVFSGPLGGPLRKFTRTNITGALSANNGAPYYGGAEYNTGATLYFPGHIGASAVWTRALKDSEIAALSQNPWQLFRAPSLPIFFADAGGGSAHDLAASSGAQSSGGASPSADVALAGVAVALASGSAGISVDVALSATGLAVSAGSAALEGGAVTDLAGDGSAVADGSAGLSATVSITAAGLAQAAASAGLSADVLLAGAAAATASGNAELSATLNALAAGAAAAGGSGTLEGGSLGDLAAPGAAIATGAAGLAVTVSLSADGIASASGTADGAVDVSVGGSGSAQSGGSATLDPSAAGAVSGSGVAVALTMPSRRSP